MLRHQFLFQNLWAWSPFARLVSSLLLVVLMICYLYRGFVGHFLYLMIHCGRLFLFNFFNPPVAMADSWSFSTGEFILKSWFPLLDWIQSLGIDFRLLSWFLYRNKILALNESTNDALSTPRGLHSVICKIEHNQQGVRSFRLSPFDAQVSTHLKRITVFESKKGLRTSGRPLGTSYL